VSLAAIRTTPLSIDEAYQAVCSDAQGGIALFVGRVRSVNHGNDITKLEYEAYVSMAEKEIRRIIDEIQVEVPGTLLACTHRIGALGVGDLAVVCAASAPHRGEAFAACRLLIDRVKVRIPIWKREHGPTGPYWIDFQPGA
jgi:molybdopterin synthase catalytic subunit